MSEAKTDPRLTGDEPCFCGRCGGNHERWARRRRHRKTAEEMSDSELAEELLFRHLPYGKASDDYRIYADEAAHRLDSRGRK